MSLLGKVTPQFTVCQKYWECLHEDMDLHVRVIGMRVLSWGVDSYVIVNDLTKVLNEICWTISICRGGSNPC